jgi:hypothetical protein
MPTFENNTDSPIIGTIIDAQGGLQSIAVLPGASISVYTYSVPSGLTKTSDEPYYNPMTAAPGAVSLTAAGAEVSITGLSKAVHAAVTAVSHGLVTGDYAYINADVGGMTEIRDRIVKVTKVDDDHVTLDNVDSRTFTTFTSGGKIRKITPALVAIPSETDKLKVYGINQETGIVRVCGQSPINHPHLGDVIDQFDMILTGIRSRWTYLALCEIAGVALTTVYIEQRGQ